LNVHWVLVVVHRDNHHGWALSLLSDLEEGVTMGALFIAGAAEIKCFAHDTLVPDSDDGSHLATLAAGSTVLNELLSSVDRLDQ
jgi:hypothetical protein